MPDDSETYLAVLRAVYDYEPQPDAEDEIAIKEDQVLLLIERVDDELSLRPTPPSYVFHLTPNRSLQLVEGQAETR